MALPKITKLSTPPSRARPETFSRDADALLGGLPQFVDETNALAAAVEATFPAALPTGMIVMWSGSIATIPAGWLLCNGQNGTPDLRGRFVLGAGGDFGVGAQGGSADAVVVSHSHEGTTSGQSANHEHFVNVTSAGAGGHAHGPAQGAGFLNTGASGFGLGTNSDGLGVFESGTTGAVGDHAHSVSGWSSGVSADHAHLVYTSATGQSGQGANMPPYYAIAYIMKS
jgi:hypothetical protein